MAPSFVENIFLRELASNMSANCYLYSGSILETNKNVIIATGVGKRNQSCLAASFINGVHPESTLYGYDSPEWKCYVAKFSSRMSHKFERN